MSAEHSIHAPQNEEWKDVLGVAFYQASSFGRIRSLSRVINNRMFTGRVLRASPNRKGYLHVSVGSPAKPKSVARLVALAFIGAPPSAGLEVNHKDGDKTNNRPDNLEYATSAENNHHALKTGLRKLKVTDEQIGEMRALEGHVSLREIGRRFGVHHCHVRYLLDGKRKVKK